MTDEERVKHAFDLMERMRKMDPAQGTQMLMDNMGNSLGAAFMQMAVDKIMGSTGPLDAVAMASGLMSFAYILAKKECGQLIEPQWTMKGADA